MTKEAIYTYVGTNGTIVSPVHLEGIPSVVKYKLKAEGNKILTDGNIRTVMVTVPADNLENWREVDK